jgi:hypothetical protein
MKVSKEMVDAALDALMRTPELTPAAMRHVLETAIAAYVPEEHAAAKARFARMTPLERQKHSASKRINDLIENNNEKHQQIIALKAMLAKYGAPIEADSNSITGRAFQNIAGGQGGCLNQALDKADAPIEYLPSVMTKELIDDGWRRWSYDPPHRGAVIEWRVIGDDTMEPVTQFIGDDNHTPKRDAIWRMKLFAF